MLKRLLVVNHEAVCMHYVHFIHLQEVLLLLLLLLQLNYRKL